MALTTLAELAELISEPKADEIEFKPGAILVMTTADKGDIAVYGNVYGNVHGKTVAAPEVPTTSPELAREKALAYVREARAVVGAKKLEKLPRGRVGKGDECVLARALPYCVSVQGSFVVFKDATIAGKVAQAWATKAWGLHVETPGALRHFVYHFDNRQYEDLIA